MSGTEKIIASHWTRFGTLMLKPAVLRGNYGCRLFVGERDTGVFMMFPNQFVALADGGYDAELRFSAKEAGIPASFGKWNNLR